MRIALLLVLLVGCSTAPTAEPVEFWAGVAVIDITPSLHVPLGGYGGRKGKPMVGVHNLSWRGAGHLSILWLRLPLATDGKDVDMILGYDAVVGHGGEVSGIRAA